MMSSKVRDIRKALEAEKERGSDIAISKKPKFKVPKPKEEPYPTAKVLLRFYPDLGRRLKEVAADRHTSLQALFLEALQVFLEKDTPIKYEMRWRFAPGILERMFEIPDPSSDDLNDAARVVLGQEIGVDLDKGDQ